MMAEQGAEIGVIKRYFDPGPQQLIITGFMAYLFQSRARFQVKRLGQDHLFTAREHGLGNKQFILVHFGKM